MFADMKVSTRLALAFSAVLVVLLAILLTGITRLAVVNGHLHAITDENDVEERAAREIRQTTWQIGVVVRNTIIDSDPEQLKKEREELEGLLRAQFGLRMQLATQQLSNTSQLKKVKRDIARVRTIMKEKAAK